MLVVTEPAVKYYDIIVVFPYWSANKTTNDKLPWSMANFIIIEILLGLDHPVIVTTCVSHQKFPLHIKINHYLWHWPG